MWLLKKNSQEASQKFRVGISAKTRTSIKDPERPAGPKDWSLFVVFALILSNAFFVLLSSRREDPRTGGEDSEMTHVAGSPPLKFIGPGISADAKELEKFLHDHYELLGMPVHRRHVSSGHGLQSFALLSSFRCSPTLFAAVGLGATVLHDVRQVEGCRWEGANHTVANGSVSLHYPGEANHMRYETLIILCNIAKTPLTGEGFAGRLVVTLDKTDVTLFRHGDDAAVQLDRAIPPLKHNLSLCASPSGGLLRPESLRQWLEFHRIVHGVAFFLLYDVGGWDDSVWEVLEPYTSRHLMKVVDAKEVALYDTWMEGQVLLANDCLFRSRTIAKWTLFLHPDEYLTVPQQPPTSAGLAIEGAPVSLLQYLELHAKDVSWVAFASAFFSISHCRTVPLRGVGDVEKDGGLWEVERAIFREPLEKRACKKGRAKKVAAGKADSSTCSPEEVAMGEGKLQWKYAVKPQQVLVVHSRRVLNPGPKRGHNVPFTALHVSTFTGLLQRDQGTCRFVWESGSAPPHFTADLTVASLAATAREQQPLSWYAVP
eukprot:TRINITY_DN11731_c0_g1_i1.p1 TRINITY_DN11731_c0_g1~~TRINITY_DN11731_c0_g1_i1.p1  ORF type:complete len:543 (-),score=94.32 TRINITY_DN11731_c0_g1_i1:310-1938(-)